MTSRRDDKANLSSGLRFFLVHKRSPHESYAIICYSVAGWRIGIDRGGVSRASVRRGGCQDFLAYRGRGKYLTIIFRVFLFPGALRLASVFRAFV
jgi:hypothetical protein